MHALNQCPLDTTPGSLLFCLRIGVFPERSKVCVCLAESTGGFIPHNCHLTLSPRSDSDGVFCASLRLLRYLLSRSTWLSSYCVMYGAQRTCQTSSHAICALALHCSPQKVDVHGIPSTFRLLNHLVFHTTCLACPMYAVI